MLSGQKAWGNNPRVCQRMSDHQGWEKSEDEETVWPMHRGVESCAGRARGALHGHDVVVESLGR